MIEAGHEFELALKGRKWIIWESRMGCFSEKNAIHICIISAIFACGIVGCVSNDKVMRKSYVKANVAAKAVDAEEKLGNYYTNPIYEQLMKQGYLAGRIIKVKPPLIIINIGIKQGVKNGMIMVVCRGPDYVMKIEIEETFENQSNAISHGIVWQKPLRGDVVFLEKKE